MFLEKVLKKKASLLTVDNLSLQVSPIYSLKNISFDIQNLDFVCIGGDENAGYIIKILSGLMSPDSGKIRFNKTPLFGSFNLKQIYKNFGYVDEKNTLYDNLTVVENMRYFGTLYDMAPHILEKNIVKLLRMVGFGKYQDMKICDLPITMQKKANIVCALVSNPKVLFCDNFTTDLDYHSRRAIFALLKDLKKHGMTVVISDMDYEPFVKFFDHVILVQNGKVTYDSKKKKGKTKLLYKVTFKSEPGTYDNFSKILENHKNINAVQIAQDKCVLTLDKDANILPGLLRMLKDYQESLNYYHYEKVEVKNG